MWSPFLVLASAAAGLGGDTDAAETGPQDPPARSWVMVRDGRGEPVEGARGVLILEPQPNLATVPGWIDVDPGAGTLGELLWANPARQTGIMTWTYRGQPRAGQALLTSDDGLGAFVPRLLAGEARRAQLQPIGRIEAPGAELCTFLATAWVDGQRIPLPAMRAPVLPLPAASYECWVVREDPTGGCRVHWQRVELAAGQGVTLDFGGSTRSLVRARDATVTPASRPDLLLLGPERDRCTLYGDALTAPLTTRLPATGLVLAGQTLANAPGTGAVSWPREQTVPDVQALTVPFTVPAADAPAQVAGFVVRRQENGAWGVLGACTSRAGDRLPPLQLPAVQGGDDWLLLVADGLAPRALPLATWRPETPIALERGTNLGVACRGQGGTPQTDVRLEYVPARGDAAAATAHTDQRGQAHFGRVQLPGVLRVSDPRWLNDEQAVTPPLAETVRILLDPGSVLAGSVRLPDGSPAAGATVTLRDPRGLLRPMARSVAADADGAFAFAGLPEEIPFVLSASLRHAENTWSCKLGARAGNRPITVTIRHEDPEPPAGRRR